MPVITHSRGVVLVLCLLVPLPAALGQQRLPEGVEVTRDVEYGKAGDLVLQLDLYLPKKSVDRPRPVVVWIHGGGWQRGDKSEVQLKPQAFVERGFVFVSTNYRFVPQVTIREMAGDVAKAIVWAHGHAGEYGGNPNQFFVMGHSAGAQLAALVCTDSSYLKAEGLPLSFVRGCVPVDGDTYDVPLQIATVEERRANIYKMKFGDEKSQKDLSPVTHVTKDRSPGDKGPIRAARGSDAGCRN
jgi:arylformamidase